MRASLRSRLVRQVISRPDPVARLRASGLGGTPPALELYYEVGDPWSHLCARWLARNRTAITCPIRIQLVPEPESALFPEPERQRQYANADAERMAPAWNIPLPPTLHWADAPLRRTVEQALVATASLEQWLETEAELIPCLLSNDASALKAALNTRPLAEDTRTRECLAAGANRRQQLRHYLPAMWQYRGDWFWGLDRLPHLLARLRHYQVLAAGQPIDDRAQTGLLTLPDTAAGSTLEFFYSFRSPYSYLAAEKLRQRIEQWPFDLVIRPVLPMVMRGFKVPSAKRLYIARDTYREAQRQGIAFGLVEDPLGPGILQGLQLFLHFEHSHQQLAFLCEYGAASWARGLDVCDPAVARQAVEAAGGNWSQAQRLLRPDEEPAWVADNREALLKRGLWGVPSFGLGDLQIWGQDRMSLLEECASRLSNQSGQ